MRITINIPQAVLYDTKMSYSDCEQYIRKIIALNFYVDKGVSLKLCAKIAGVTDADFIRILAEDGIHETTTKGAKI